MSNIKDVQIVAQVPFNILNELSDEDAALFARLFLTPSSGLSMHTRRQVGYVPNKFGGKTAMYEVIFDGQEAVRFETLELLVDIIQKHEGKVSYKHIVDLEA